MENQFDALSQFGQAESTAPMRFWRRCRRERSSGGRDDQCADRRCRTKIQHQRSGTGDPQPVSHVYGGRFLPICGILDSLMDWVDPDIDTRVNGADEEAYLVEPNLPLLGPYLVKTVPWMTSRNCYSFEASLPNSIMACREGFRPPTCPWAWGMVILDLSTCSTPWEGFRSTSTQPPRK